MLGGQSQKESGVFIAMVVPISNVELGTWISFPEDVRAYKKKSIESTASTREYVSGKMPPEQKKRHPEAIPGTDKTKK